MADLDFLTKLGWRIIGLLSGGYIGANGDYASTFGGGAEASTVYRPEKSHYSFVGAVTYLFSQASRRDADTSLEGGVAVERARTDDQTWNDVMAGIGVLIYPLSFKPDWEFALPKIGIGFIARAGASNVVTHRDDQTTVFADGDSTPSTEHKFQDLSRWGVAAEIAGRLEFNYHEVFAVGEGGVGTYPQTDGQGIGPFGRIGLGYSF